MAFAQSYLPGVPAGTDIANQLDTFIQNFKVANNERIALEHRDLDTGNSNDAADDAQGRHIPGFVSAVLIDTFANIDALTKGGSTGVHNGALAFSTGDGILRIFDGTDWTTVTVAGVLGGPIITAATVFGNVTQTGWTDDPLDDADDLAELVDEDNVAVTAVGTVAQDAIAFVQVDLGAIFHGTVKLKFDASVTASAGRWVVSPAANELEAVWNTTAIEGAVHSQHLIDNNTTLRTYASVTPFSGRFVGFYMSNSAGSGVCSIQLRRLEIHGVAE